MLNLKFFERKHQKSQQKKDFLIVIIFSSILIFAVFYYTFIFKSPTSSTHLATVKINFQGEIDTDDYVDGNFELESPDDDMS